MALGVKVHCMRLKCSDGDMQARLMHNTVAAILSHCSDGEWLLASNRSWRQAAGLDPGLAPSRLGRARNLLASTDYFPSRKLG